LNVAIPESFRFPTRVRSGVESWSNPRILLIFALIFVCGFAAGSATIVLFHAHIVPEAKRRVDVESLKAQLHLTPEQAATVDKELDDYAKYYQNIQEEREDVAEHGMYRILAVLNPEQKKQFLRLFRAEPLVRDSPSH
jgi:hypothetical protein